MGTERPRPRRVLVVGPDPARAPMPGGHVADVSALLEVLGRDGHDAAVLDTTGAEDPGRARKVVRGAGRLAATVRAAVQARPDLAILLASGPASLVEKAMMAGILRAFGVRTVLCPRSGHVATAAGSPVRIRVLRRAVRVPHALAVQTAGWRDFYVETLGAAPERTHVVENWAATDALRELTAPREERESLRVVYAAGLHPAKGIDDVLAALPGLLPHLVAAGGTFHIVGDGPAAGAVRELAATHAPHVSWHAPMTRESFLPFLARSHVLVAPSRVEGFPNLLVEAACLGVAIVATPVGGVPDVVESGVTGLLVEPDQPEALCAAVRDLLRDEGLRARLAGAAREQAMSRFDAETNVRRLLDAGMGGSRAHPV